MSSLQVCQVNLSGVGLTAQLTLKGKSQTVHGDMWCSCIKVGAPDGPWWHVVQLHQSGGTWLSWCAAKHHFFGRLLHSVCKTLHFLAFCPVRDSSRRSGGCDCLSDVPAARRSKTWLQTVHVRATCPRSRVSSPFSHSSANCVKTLQLWDLLNTLLHNYELWLNHIT